MFLLRLLGGASLEGEDGVLSGPATQRHRLALLALLSLTRSRAQSRERLCAWLWPERDADRARNLLNQSVHALRRALGAGAIISTGDELRLDPSIVRCDAAQFEEAVEQRDWDHAVELYAGPFLDGFYLGEDEFERWAEDERQRLRRSYQQALASLADAAESRGDATAAVRWWRTLAAEDPFPAATTVRLMEALEAAGDRAGAILQAEEHNRLLERELDAEPNPMVVALAERMRRDPAERTFSSSGTLEREPIRRSGGPPRETRTDPARGGHARGPEESPTAGPVAVGQTAAHRVGHPRRRGPRARRAAILPMIVGAILLTAYLVRKPTAAEPSRGRVVVAPFENRTGDPRLDPVGIMAADWITQTLGLTDLIDVVPATVALAALRSTAPDSVSGRAEPVVAVATETDAGIVVSGAYYLRGDSVRFQAQITDARRSALLEALDPVLAAAADPIPALDALGEQTLAALAPLLDDRLSALAGVTSRPPSYQAYRAYAEGADAFVRGDFPQAIEHYERAMAVDSTYLLPRLAFAVAHGNLGNLALADSITAELNRSRDQLGPYERALLDLQRAWLTPDPIARYEAAKRAATVAPNTLPHVQWGMEALRINRPGEAIRILSELDPTRGIVRGWVPYWTSLTEAHHRLGQHRQELQQARRARSLEPSNMTYLWLEARALIALARIEEMDRLIDHALSLPGRPSLDSWRLLGQVALELRAHGEMGRAQRVLERAVALAESKPAEEMRQRRALLGHMLALAGREDEGDALIRVVVEERPEAIRIQLWGLLGVLAVRRGDRGEADRIVGWLSEQNPRYYEHMPLYWRGIIAAQMGRKAEATALVREALARGMFHGSDLHANPFLDPLREYPPFIELLRPTG